MEKFINICLGVVLALTVLLLASLALGIPVTELFSER